MSQPTDNKLPLKGVWSEHAFYMVRARILYGQSTHSHILRVRYECEMSLFIFHKVA